jgi:hypothetical protein
LLLKPLPLLHVVAQFSLCEKLFVALSLLPLLLGSCFGVHCNLRKRNEQAAVAVSLYVCVQVKPVSNNRLSWLKFFMLPSQSFREYV